MAVVLAYMQLLDVALLIGQLLILVCQGALQLLDLLLPLLVLLQLQPIEVAQCRCRQEQWPHEPAASLLLSIEGSASEVAIAAGAFATAASNLYKLCCTFM